MILEGRTGLLPIATCAHRHPRSSSYPIFDRESVRCYGNTRSRNAICRCLIYALQNIETRGGPLGIRTAVPWSEQREYYSKCCSFGHVDRGRSKSGFDRTQRHVTTRGNAFRGSRVSTLRSYFVTNVYKLLGNLAEKLRLFKTPHFLLKKGNGK